MVYTISQIAYIEREWPPFMQCHRILLTPSYIEYIALTTTVPFNTGHPSAASRSRQLKAALQVFSHYKVPLTFRYSWKRLRKRHSKNLIKFPQVCIAFVLQHVHCFEKKNTYWLNESWETRLPKRLKCTIVCINDNNQIQLSKETVKWTLWVRVLVYEVKMNEVYRIANVEVDHKK